MDRPLALQVIETVVALGRGSDPRPNARSHFPMTEARALLPALLRPEASADWRGDDYVLTWPGGEVKLVNVRRFLAPKAPDVGLSDFLTVARGDVHGSRFKRYALAEADGTVVVTDGWRLHVESHDPPAAPMLTCEAVAENVRVGRASPQPRPMIRTPARSTSKPSVAAMVSACPGMTKIVSPLEAVHRLIAWSMVAIGLSGLVPGLVDAPVVESTQKIEPVV